MTISSVNGGKPYIDSKEGIEKYGIREAYRDYSDYDDPEKLKAFGEWDLKGEGNDFRLDRPQLTITGDVVDLSKLAEYGDFYKIALGDTVHVFEDNIEHKQRIVSMTYYPYSAKQPSVTIGQPTLVNPYYHAWYMGKLIKTIQKNSGRANKLKTSYFHGTVNSTQNPVRSDNKQLLLDGDLLSIKDSKRIRIRIGNYNGEFVFIIYDVKGNKAVYLNEDGEAVFSGTIETMQDCIIQGMLRVGMAGNNTKGIEFYGDTYSSQSECYAKMLPYVDVGGELKGINIEGGLWLNGYYVANENQIGDLRKRIALLEGKINELKNSLK